jgi:hypothetical protein
MDHLCLKLRNHPSINYTCIQYGMTALMYAAYTKESDKDSENDNGQKLLSDKKACIELLLNYGANKTSRNLVSAL